MHRDIGEAAGEVAGCHNGTVTRHGAGDVAAAQMRQSVDDERAALGADEHVVVYLFAAVITFLHEAYSLYNILKYPACIVAAFVRKVKCAETGTWEAHFLQGIKQFFAFTWREISI